MQIAIFVASINATKGLFSMSSQHSRVTAQPVGELDQPNRNRVDDRLLMSVKPACQSDKQQMEELLDIGLWTVRLSAILPQNHMILFVRLQHPTGSSETSSIGAGRIARSFQANGDSPC